MNFHVLTLFPDMIEQAFHTSITGKAVESGQITLETVNIRDYTKNKHKKVDDYPYGGGAGMLMQAQPVYDAFEAVKCRILHHNPDREETLQKNIRCIYVTPQGTPFTQEMAQEMAQEEELVFLCGHYEGIDERVLEEIVTDYVSIGDYVLTGGELPAMVMMDAIARLVPGVLHNEESAQTESFHRDLLEHPHYSRPEVWHDKPVPKVLLSGDHQKIAAWRLEQSVQRTRERRPDLYEKYCKAEEVIVRLMKEKVLHFDMIDALRRGSAMILYEGEHGVALWERQSGCYQLSAAAPESAQALLAMLPETDCVVWLHQKALLHALQEKQNKLAAAEYYQAVYTRAVPFANTREWPLRKCTASEAKKMLEEAGMDQENLRLDSFYGIAEKEGLSGVIGMHQSGSMDALYVRKACRRKGIAEALEKDCINRLLCTGKPAYCRILAQDKTTYALQEKLGLRISKTGVWKVKIKLDK